MIRAFLGLDLPGEIRSALAVQQFFLPLPRRVEPELMHLTLVFLGEVAEPALEAAHEAFAALKIAPFPLSLQGLGLFGGTRPKVAWAGVAPSDPLMRLQAKAEQAARGAGLAPEHRRFAPHVTLGRFPPPPPTCQRPGRTTARRHPPQRRRWLRRWWQPAPAPWR